MSIFAAIQKSASALQVADLGLQVVGNNVANAGTPGYIRQELVTTAGPPVRIGPAIVGSGVRATGVVQKLDQYVIDRMRQTRSELEASQRQADLFGDLDSVLNEFSDHDLSSLLSNFSSSIQDLLNQPGNEALRRLVIERGHVLAQQIQSVGQQLKTFGDSLNQETGQTVDQINRLTQRIAKLNTRIVELEGGRESKTSDAVGLRDERLQALDELSTFVNIHAVEQESGAVSVFVGGEYLVADGIHREVKVELTQAEDGQTIPEVRLVDTDSPLRATGGRLGGILAARASGVEAIGATLDQFARTVIDQFNAIHTQGQGAVGLSDVTSYAATDDPLGALDLAGYTSRIKNGDFQIQVKDTNTGSVATHTIRIQLTGATDDTSLADVRDQLDAISGISSSITSEGRLQISADSGTVQFSFQNDTANFLATVGVNTFFVGDSASNIAVNSIVASDPRKLAASLTGIGYGTDNALRMAQAFEDPIDSLGGRSLKETYEDMVVGLAQQTSVQNGKSEGLQNFYNTLEAKHLAISGVNLDEEAVKMIFYQRMYQANSKLIQTANEMLDTLVSL